ncbi:hypothetical protein VTK73DRAFT_3156 [Phialemonium thermophilum]|uniref:Uncharacterized protein n=1 Tax=Phialemonium thermophilum TaxID=223376 RepID=A0ABR3VKS5_9PEZI
MDPSSSRPEEPLSPASREAIEHWIDQQSLERRRDEEFAVPKPRNRWDAAAERPDSFDPRSFLRVASLNLCSAIFGINVVLGILVGSRGAGDATRSTPRGTTLDTTLSPLISVPAAGAAFIWELSRFAVVWLRSQPREAMRDAAVDATAHAVLGFTSAICTILAAFQAAQHRAFNTRSRGGVGYRDVEPCIALSALLGLLM